MISKETYRNLVLAGCNLVKDIIQVEELIEECTEHEIDMPAKVFDYMTTSPHTVDAFQSIVWVAGEMEFGVEHPHDLLRIKYADAVSLFVFNNTNAERYLELLYELLTTDTVPEELLAIEKQVSPDIIYWVRRNLSSVHPPKTLNEI